MRKILDLITYYFVKIYVFTYIFFKKITGIKWEKVNSIYLPLDFSIGFDTLRWIVNHQYEINEIQIIQNTIQTEDIVLEIGTGLGFISSFCCKKNNNKVYTFEANPNNYEICKNVFIKNGVNPNHQNIVLSNDEGTINFSVNNKRRLASSLLNKNENITLIQTQNLNNIISSVKPNYLIMDIEGGEYEIFKIIDFQYICKVQFELHPQLLDESKCVEIFDLLEANHFTKNETLSKNNNFYETLFSLLDQ